MSKLSQDRSGFSATPLHPRENLIATGTIAAANGEVVVFNHAGGIVSLDLRGTFVGTFAVEGTVDGTNYTLIPVKPRTGGIYLLGVTTPGVWIGASTGYDKVRVRCTAYTSGSATATLLSQIGAFNDYLGSAVTATIVTATGAAAAAVTLTLAAPGAGLRHYLTYLTMVRFNGTAAALTAALVPVVCTTTNLPGSLAFSRAADALAAGAADHWREDFSYPLAASAQNTATTIVCPATTGVLWRVTAGYYVAP